MRDLRGKKCSKGYGGQESEGQGAKDNCDSTAGGGNWREPRGNSRSHLSGYLQGPKGAFATDLHRGRHSREPNDQGPLAALLGRLSRLLNYPERERILGRPPPTAPKRAGAAEHNRGIW
eukprot:855767-Prorocentrum_minimum.AAC.5